MVIYLVTYTTQNFNYRIYHPIILLIRKIRLQSSWFEPSNLVDVSE